MNKIDKRNINHASSRRLFHSKLRLKLWRWHRRLGLVSALFVILLATTGILLNHGHALGLDKASLPPSLLSFFYQVEPPSLRSVAIGDVTITQLGPRQLFMNEVLVADCEGKLIGATLLNDIVTVACANDILLVTLNGDLIDQLIANDAVFPVETFGVCQGSPCWQSESLTSYILNTDDMAIQVSDIQPSVSGDPVSLSNHVEKALVNSYRGDIVWERWLQDLHSGRLFGAFGPWMMDLMAFFFLIIASSGVVMWGLGRKK